MGIIVLFYYDNKYYIEYKNIYEKEITKISVGWVWKWNYLHTIRQFWNCFGNIWDRKKKIFSPLSRMHVKGKMSPLNGMNVSKLSCIDTSAISKDSTIYPTLHAKQKR